VIAAHGLRSVVRKRAFLFLMILSWIPVVVRGVQIWAAANVPATAASSNVRLITRLLEGGIADPGSRASRAMGAGPMPACKSSAL